MFLIVDRIEGELVVLEFRGETLSLPRALFPAQVKEGDVVRFTIDRDATRRRREEALRRFKRLMEE